MVTMIGWWLVAQATAQDISEARVQASASRVRIDDALAVVEALEPSNEEQVQCITPKRDALRLLRDVGMQIEGDLLDALADGKEQHVSLSLRKLVVAQSRAEQLRAEAEACMPSASASENTVTLLTEPLATGTEETDTAPEDTEHPDPPPSSQFE